MSPPGCSGMDARSAQPEGCGSQAVARLGHCPCRGRRWAALESRLAASGRSGRRGGGRAGRR
eukprot:1295808-Pyramimonas_sp.AAC.1